MHALVLDRRSNLGDLPHLVSVVLHQLTLLLGHRVRPLGRHKLVFVVPSHHLPDALVSLFGLAAPSVRRQDADRDATYASQYDTLLHWAQAHVPGTREVPDSSRDALRALQGSFEDFWNACFAHVADVRDLVVVCTATTSAGLTAAASVFLALQETEFLSLEEQARQRLTAGLTRSTGPLLIVAPLFRHGLLAAYQMHAHLTGHSRCKSALANIWQRHERRTQGYFLSSLLPLSGAPHAKPF